MRQEEKTRKLWNGDNADVENLTALNRTFLTWKKENYNG